jgi:hypothetical protein
MRNVHLTIFNSETMLHKDYYRKSSVEKKNLGPDTKTNWLVVNRQS